MNTRRFQPSPLSMALGACLLSLAGSQLATAADIRGQLHLPATAHDAGGARIRLVGTHYTALTDAHGRFAMTGVPAGRYTVAVSLTGYAPIQQTLLLDDAHGILLELDLKKSTQLKTIAVAANRYDASSMQMDAINNVNVMSADDLQHTAVHNVAEALGLLPGVNVFNTGQSYFGGVDGASRGEGMFTSVRGMNAEYDVNLIDGVEVAQGMPYSRGVQLSLLPPSGLQTIVLNKTSTPDMDGDAIGGTIDFRTPTAFDFAATTSGSITASGRMESRARDYGDDGLGGGLSAEIQHKFGSQHQFGLYASGYYDSRSYVNSQLAAATAANGDGAWEFIHTDARGHNPAGYDPAQNIESTGMYTGTSSGDEHRYGGNVSFDWKVDETLHAYARATYANAKTEQNTNYLQLIPANVSYIPVTGSPLYQPRIGRVATRYWYETNPEKADLETVQLGFDKTLGGWTLSPNLFYSWGHDDRPDHVEISARQDEYSAADYAYGGSRLMSYGANGFPYPTLSPAMQDQLNHVAGMYARRAGERSESYSGQEKAGAKFDARYDFQDGPLESVQLGAKFLDSHREFTFRDWTTAKYTDGSRFGSLGLIDGGYASVFPGIYPWAVPSINQAALKRLIAAHLTDAALDTCGALYINNMNCDTQRGREAVTSAYAMATLRWGNLEVVPGLRFEHTDITNSFWVSPQDASGGELPGNFGHSYTHYDTPLPSILANYRPNDHSVYRASVWTSYTRPPFVQLGGGRQVAVSADGLTTITEGNPDLKPIRSLNTDLSGEWDNGRGGHAMVSLFYKGLSDYIYENGSGAVNAGSIGDGLVEYIRPRNGGNGTVYGIEVALREKLQNLPAPLDGFGVGINATGQKTSVDLGMAGFHHQRMQNAPNVMANAQFFYEKHGFSVDLSYHYAGSYISTYDYLGQGGPWDDLWVRPIKRLDLHAGYAFSNRWRADLSISNLAKNYSYWAHIGHHNLALSDVVDSGMTGLLSVKYNF